MQTLSREQLRSVAPSIFAPQPWDGVSPKSYRYIPTHEVLDTLEDQGFRVTKAMQSKSRIEGKRPFSRHMLRLRHIDAPSGPEVPEVVLVNSHDRSSAYRLFSGIFRLVCENGMIVQSADFGSFSIRHSGSRDLFAQIKDATSRIMDGIPGIMQSIDDWKNVILPRHRQIDFAKEAWHLKPTDAIKPAFLLTARRDEDLTDAEGNRDLWRSFQVVQESLMKGGLTGYNARGRRVTTRAIKSVTADISLNRSLWTLAQAYSQN